MRRNCTVDKLRMTNFWGAFVGIKSEKLINCWTIVWWIYCVLSGYDCAVTEIVRNAKFDIHGWPAKIVLVIIPELSAAVFDSDARRPSAVPPPLWAVHGPFWAPSDSPPSPSTSNLCSCRNIMTQEKWNHSRPSRENYSQRHNEGGRKEGQRTGHLSAEAWCAAPWLDCLCYRDVSVRLQTKMTKETKWGLETATNTKKMINQSINHSTNQSNNQSIEQSIIQPINRTINQPINRTIDQSTSCALSDRPTSQLISQ